MNWSNKKSLLAQLEKLWDKGLLLEEQWLMDQNQTGSIFPRRLVFKSPDNQALSNQFDSVRKWVGEIQQLEGFRIVYRTVRHRIIGENPLPDQAWVDSLDIALKLLDRKHDAEVFSHLVARTRSRVPQLMEWVRKNPLKLLAVADRWPRLLNFIEWRQHHTQPDIYLRQVSLAGIDSKFIERHKSLLTTLLDLSLSEEEINKEAAGSRRFEQRYGFLSKPERVRFRPLDPALTLLPDLECDISMSTRDFQVLGKTPEFIDSLKHVFMTENEINYLTFPPMKNSLVIFGSGYGFSMLADIDWLKKVNIFYWGDIDTHGFAILDQLRSRTSHVRSLLMDETTLLEHREFWGVEPVPERRTLRNLTPDEEHLYLSLVENRYANSLRLEQEQIAFSYLTQELDRRIRPTLSKL